MLYIAGCRGHPRAVESTRAALDRLGLDLVPVGEIQVSTAEDLARFDFHGSPTVVVDGLDLFPTTDRVAGLACRIYPSSEGPREAPPVDDLAAAIAERAHP